VVYKYRGETTPKKKDQENLTDITRYIRFWVKKLSEGNWTLPGTADATETLVSGKGSLLGKREAGGKENAPLKVRHDGGLVNRKEPERNEATFPTLFGGD